MRDRWIGRNVDLQLLCECLERFFRSKRFWTSAKESSKGYRVVAIPKHPHDLAENVNVFVKGNPDDFVIEFIAGSRSRFFVKFGFLATLFGGGMLLSRSLKSLEECEKLEKEFWPFVEEKIDFLSHTA